MSVRTRSAARPRRRLAVAGTLALAVGLAACGTVDPELDALRSDRMAIATFDGAALVDERERAASGLVKSAPAVVRRIFEVTGEPDVVLERTVEAARGSGWAEVLGTDSFVAERTIDGVHATLRIFLDNTEEDPVLEVSLESS